MQVSDEIARTAKGKNRPERMAFANMWQRCTNPRHRYYAYYGGRGITVCER
jgi:hypothetical protein